MVTKVLMDFLIGDFEVVFFGSLIDLKNVDEVLNIEKNE
jgi:hypothetical protein